MNDTITAVPGLKVGHAEYAAALTGCTVILCEGGAVGGLDQRGGAPGSRETELLRPMHLVEKVHALVLAGGSAFGLDAASGVMRYLDERGVGFDVGVARVPIVPAAVLFDLTVGRAEVRPDAALGYAACLNASAEPVAEGNVGAGMGASVGKARGMAYAMKAGLGSACIELSGGVLVGAIVAVNAFGDVIDPANGAVIAGTRSADGWADSLQVLRASASRGFDAPGNTVIGAVATNAKLSKEHINKVAQMAQDGLARTIRPAHTLYDGDTIFALSTGEIDADVNVIGAFAAEVFAQAVLRGVRAATSAGGLPGLNEQA